MHQSAHVRNDVLDQRGGRGEPLLGLLRLLVERVAYDGGAGSLAVTFRPTGIKALADEVGGSMGEGRR